jgi:hypothetical protein
MRTSPWLTLGLLAGFPGPPADPSTPGGTITVAQPATTEQEELVAWAAHLFEAAGLALPTVEVAFSDDERDCDGHLGLFQPSREPWQITICTPLTFVPVHELAHAWIEANVDEETQETYVEHRHKSSWNSSRHDWGERGVEDAAFVIQQNLMAPPSSDLSDEWQRRASAFELLAGSPSPLRDTAS